MSSFFRFLVCVSLLCSLSFLPTCNGYGVSNQLTGWHTCIDRVTSTPISTGIYDYNDFEFFATPQITVGFNPQYRPNLNCTWFFQSVGALPGHEAHLYYELTVWDIHPDCAADHLNLYTVSGLHTFCGLPAGKTYGNDPTNPNSRYFYGIVTYPAWYTMFRFLSDGSNQLLGFSGFVWSFTTAAVGKRTPEQMRDLFSTERRGSPSAATGTSQFGQLLLRERMKQLSRQPFTLSVQQQINAVINMQDQLDALGRERRSAKTRRRSAGANNTKRDMTLVKHVWENVIKPDRLKFIRHYQRTHDVEEGCGQMAGRMQRDIVNFCLETAFKNKP